MTKKDPSWFFCHCWPDCLPAGGPLSKVICPVHLCVPVFYFFHAFSSSCVCVWEIYGWTETSHHTAPHNRQCLTSLQPKKHPETSQQCINGTAFTTVWPAVTSVPNAHTESLLQGNVMGFCGMFGSDCFWRCCLGWSCQGDKDSLTKNVFKMGFKGVVLAALMCL